MWITTEEDDSAHLLGMFVILANSIFVLCKFRGILSQKYMWFEKIIISFVAYISNCIRIFLPVVNGLQVFKKGCQITFFNCRICIS